MSEVFLILIFYDTTNFPLILIYIWDFINQYIYLFFAEQMKAQHHYGTIPWAMVTPQLRATIWVIKLTTAKTIFWWIYPPKMKLRKTMWLIVAQYTAGPGAHQLVVIIVLQLQRLQLYTMGHYPEMLLEHYAKKSICKFCSFYTCNIYKCKSILLLVRWNFFCFLSFSWEKEQQKKCQSTNNDKKKRCC